MHRVTWLLALALAACVAAPAAKVAAFRPAKAPIYSSAAFDGSRLEGEWRQVAGFVVGDESACGPGWLRFSRQMVQGKLCLNGQEVAVSGPVSMAGPGRIAVPGMADWWVLWVDSGYRTLAIGTPDGRFGFVLDRGRIGADRLAAAAEIFEFNGYSKARLRPY